jgi:hypothetical protein
MVLTACQAPVIEETAEAAPAPSSNNSTLSMADRILYQDRVNQQVSSGSSVESPPVEFTMADRLRFQDRLRSPAPALSSAVELTMANRLHFQDQRAEQ